MFVWFILAGLLGAAIGWIAHHMLKCSKKGHGAPAAPVVDTAEVDRLKARVANLEPAVKDRDALRAELAALKAKAETVKAPAPAVATFAGVAQADHDTVKGERDAALAAHNAVLAERNAAREENARLQRLVDGHAVTIADHQSNIGRMQGLLDQQTAAPAVLDLGAAEQALGFKLKLDDLKVVEGIGPKIEELCHARGIRTWRALSTTDTGLLRTMLDEAGPRFQMHEPTTWPTQAGLLADGRWAEFKELTERLDGGKPAG
jgi:predicted flap endonuclease-1-like 5' DNA nuclease